MTTPIFTWVPSRGPSKEITPRVRRASFGDGYEQRVGDGINTRFRTWSLSFNNRSESESNAIEGFLEARNGVESFTWVDPNGHSAKWICEKWSRVEVDSLPTAKLSSISTSFREVPA